MIMGSYQHTNSSFSAADGLDLFYQSWVSSEPKGIVVLAHGVGEHSGRYQNIIDKMEGQGISFYGLDHRGHGRSEGKPGHINRFTDYTSDLKRFMEIVRYEQPDHPIILMGHSMGGLIAFHYALQYPEDIEALILSSAGLIPVVPVPAWQQAMGRVLSILAPGFTMSTGLDAAGLSHDQCVVTDYLHDPLVHDKVSARWFTEFIKAGQTALQQAGKLTMPLLIIHGQDDPIVDHRGSLQTVESAASPDKTCHIFAGLLHETMNESPAQREEVLDKISEWIIKHTS